MKYLIIISFSFLSCTKQFHAVSTAQQSLVISSKPNIILVLGDDIGYEIPAYTGGQSYPTPNIDLLASVSRKYVYCYSLPLCSPSRQELFTGLYSYRNYKHWGSLDTSNITIANVLKDAGYNTCIAGKWQLDGGDASIHHFGFDKYSVWMPFAIAGDDDSEVVGASPYKSPIVYQDGGYLQNTQGKYGEDIFRNYLFNFIDSSTKPFFAVWTLNLLHPPFQPTPFDSKFSTFVSGGNKMWFPSMVKYLDYEIGLLKQKVDSTPNTILIFIVGDNGTDKIITSMFNGKSISGGKNKPDETGTRVPMIIYGNGFTGVDSNLISFVDFMPTIAAMAGTTLYNQTDGVNFLNTNRSWIFQHFQQKGIDSPQYRLFRWVQNKSYKLYDTTQAIPAQTKTGNFYRVFTGGYGQDDKLIDPPATIVEKRNDSIFKGVLSTMHN